VLAPKVAITVALWLLGIAAAVPLTVAVVAPAGTVTAAGTVSKVLLLESVIGDPPAGAACVRLTVQLVALPPFKLVGEHVIDESEGTAIVPLEDVKLRLLALGSAPTTFVSCIEFVVALAASVALT